MPISNRVQADALVQILHVIRLTRGNGVADWHPKAIENTLREGHQHPAPYPDIVVALTKYARDSDKRVPNFLFDSLADWAPPGHTAPKNPCEDHGFPAHNCHSCKADILVGDRPPEFMGKHYEVPMTGVE